MKYDGTFLPEEYKRLKEYKYRLDIFFENDTPMQTHLFKTYQQMICFIAKIKFGFMEIYILEKIEFITERPLYEIKHRINWFDYVNWEDFE